MPSLFLPGFEEDGEQTVQPSRQFNFVTHLFFLTHKCLILGELYAYWEGGGELSNLIVLNNIYKIQNMYMYLIAI